MNTAGLEKAGALVLLVLGSQAWARWRVGRRERRAQAMPLFSPIALEAALAPRPGDDPAPLEALRSVFRRHGRVRDAKRLASEVREFTEAQPPSQKAAVQRALERLSQSEDEALRRVATEVLDCLPQ